VAFPAPANRFLAERRFQEDEASFALGMLGHIRREEEEATHGAVAKLFHIMRLGWFLRRGFNELIVPFWRLLTRQGLWMAIKLQLQTKCQYRWEKVRIWS
jgi:hypothetical protein